MPDAPTILRPGEGEGTERYTLLADRDELVLTEFRYAPNQDGPQRHIHRHHADAFYCLEGRLRITLDEEDLILGPGGFALIPPEVIHAFGNPSDEPGRYLNFHAPGCGFGDYLRGDNPDFDQHYDVPPGSGRPTSEAVVRQPGEGEQLGLGPSQSSIKAGAQDGMGSLAVLESTIGPNFPGPVLHEHERMVDSFYILDGTLSAAARRRGGRGDRRLLCPRAARQRPHLLHPGRPGHAPQHLRPRRASRATCARSPSGRGRATSTRRAWPRSPPSTTSEQFRHKI